MQTDPNDLILFAEVIRAGSITGAGNKLGLPKSTVSRRISQLEERLGSQILNKTTRKLTLTEFGQTLYERAERLLEEMEETNALLGSLESAPRGRLRITTTEDFASHVLARPLACFSRKYPEITLELSLTPRVVDLIGEQIDIAIRFGPLQDSNLVVRKLMDIRVYLCASPDYIARNGQPQTPDELDHHRMVLITAFQHHPPPTLRQGKQKVDLKLHSSVWADSAGFLRHLCLEGAGIAWMPSYQVQADIDQGRLVRILPDWELDHSVAHLLTPGRRLLPTKTKAFIEFLYDYLREAREKGEPCAREYRDAKK